MEAGRTNSQARGAKGRAARTQDGETAEGGAGRRHGGQTNTKKDGSETGSVKGGLLDCSILSDSEEDEEEEEEEEEEEQQQERAGRKKKKK